MNKEDKYSLVYSIGKSIQENKDKIEKLEKQNIRFKKKNKQLKTQLDIANKKLDKIKEYADDKREGFNEDIRDYLDDNLIGNEDKVNKLREFRSWFIDILSIIGGE